MGMGAPWAGVWGWQRIQIATLSRSLSSGCLLDFPPTQGTELVISSQTLSDEVGISPWMTVCLNSSSGWGRKQSNALPGDLPEGAERAALQDHWKICFCVFYKHVLLQKLDQH